MCLGLSNKKKYTIERFEKEILYGEEHIVGYKVLDFGLTVNSPFRPGFKWKEGWNLSGRVVPLGETEKEFRSVTYGIHVIAFEKDAHRFRRLLNSGAYGGNWGTPENRHRVIKVYIKPEDVVAVGFFDGDHTEYELNLVCNKCWVQTFTALEDCEDA
jgi:hypothetical protein